LDFSGASEAVKKKRQRTMRISHIATLATVAAVTVAQPRAYGHRHAHTVVKRAPRPDTVVYAPVTMETVIKYVLDGHEISEEDVRLGLANGTLEWGADGNLSTSSKAPVAFPTPPPAPAPAPSPSPSSSPKPEQNAQPPAPKPEPAKTTTEAAEQPSSTAASKQTDSAPSPDTSLKTADQLVDKNGYCASCDIEFPNGKFDCSDFPYGYGAMPITQEGLGGWSGIQKAGYDGADGYNDIMTVPHGSCNDGSCCTPGSFCSYGCPNPYLKLSFPKKQGVTGQSVGGLFCNDKGKLEMADGSIGKTMCGSGAKEMTVKVVNRLSKPVSICRTDYPGTESMTFPLTVGPGETGYLANPDQSKYYFWGGAATSAHYYVNNQGISEADACTWAKPGDARGNWAPAIFGTSFDDKASHKGYSSLKQNELNRGTKLDYSISFEGNGVVSKCSYKKSTDQYCEDNSCWSVKDDPNRGCTVSLIPMFILIPLIELHRPVSALAAPSTSSSTTISVGVRIARRPASYDYPFFLSSSTDKVLHAIRHTTHTVYITVMSRIRKPSPIHMMQISEVFLEERGRYSPKYLFFQHCPRSLSFEGVFLHCS
jgi:hypothetical protein